MSAAISPLISSPSTANFSIFSSPGSLPSSNTSIYSAPEHRKRRRGGIKVPQKRRKTGRPRNEWTASRRRKLVRLYLFTELKVPEIQKVLKADGFNPCKKDIQDQLRVLIQANPKNIRLRGPGTMQRRRLLLDCREDRRSLETSKIRYDEAADKARNEAETSASATTAAPVNTNTFETPLDPTGEWDFEHPWLDIGSEWDSFLSSIGELGAPEPVAQHSQFVERFDSPTISPLTEGFDLASFPKPPSLPQGNQFVDSLQGTVLSNLSQCPILPSHRTHSIPPRFPLPSKTSLSIYLLESWQGGDDVLDKDFPLPDAVEMPGPLASELTPLNSDNDSMLSCSPALIGSEAKTNDQLPLRLKNRRSKSLSVASLINRLSTTTEKYTHSTLEEVVSVMHCTISTSSSASVAPSRRNMTPTFPVPIARKAAQILPKLDYLVILPGAFPEYCWEEIMNNRLSRCERGQKYRKARICTHIVRRQDPPARSDGIFNLPGLISELLKDSQTPHYKVYAGPGGDKVDIFGNSALHVAAALATPPDTLIDLIGSKASVHTVNNAGQTFLHLFHPDSLDFSGPATGIGRLLSKLKELNFNFNQQDHHGRTSLHWLTQPGIPRSIGIKISDEIVAARVPLLTSRDNLGFSVTEQMRFWGNRTAQMHTELRFSRYAAAFAGIPEDDEDAFIGSHQANAVIQEFGEFQRLAYHADLLKTIRQGQANAWFEDSSGRNGLHCLAEVSFDLALPNRHAKSTRLPQIKIPSAAHLETSLDHLLQVGVDPNNHNKDGDSPFMAFIIHERADEDDDTTTRVLRRLFDAGADIHRRNRQGETPLHLAVKFGRRAATKFLLSVGANVHARAGNGLGIVALGYKSVRDARESESRYAQIMLCVALVSSGGAVSAPTILGEWGTKSLVELRTLTPTVEKSVFETGESSSVELPTSVSPTAASGRQTPDYFGRQPRYRSPTKSFSAPKTPSTFARVPDPDFN